MQILKELQTMLIVTLTVILLTLTSYFIFSTDDGKQIEEDPVMIETPGAYPPLGDFEVEFYLPFLTDGKIGIVNPFEAPKETYALDEYVEDLFDVSKFETEIQIPFQLEDEPAIYPQEEVLPTPIINKSVESSVSPI